MIIDVSTDGTLSYPLTPRLAQWLTDSMAELASDLAMSGDCDEFGSNCPDDLAYGVNEDFWKVMIKTIPGYLPQPIAGHFDITFAQTMTYEMEFQCVHDANVFQEVYSTPEELFDTMEYDDCDGTDYARCWECGDEFDLLDLHDTIMMKGVEYDEILCDDCYEKLSDKELS